MIDLIHRLLYDLGMTGQTNEPAVDLPLHPTQAEIVASLEGAILVGRIATGTRLPSGRAFAERSGISRTALREALRTLAAQNLVEIVPGRGAFVRQARTTDGVLPAAPTTLMTLPDDVTPGPAMLTITLTEQDQRESL